MGIDLYRPMVTAFDRLYLDRHYERVVEGEENIPEVPAMHVSNHLRFDDSFLLASTVTRFTKRPVRFGAKSEYFDGRGVDGAGRYGRSVKFFMNATRMIPVYRDDNVRAFPLLSKGAKAAFDRGDSVALHAEGSRSRDGRLNRFKSGASRIVLQTLAPVVPVGLLYEEQGESERTLSMIRFGEPILPEEYLELSPDDKTPRALAAALTNLLEERVSELTGQVRSGIDARDDAVRLEAADEPRP